MRVANLLIRLFFIIAMAMSAVVLGMWLGLKAVDGYKLTPKVGLMYCQHNWPIKIVKQAKGGNPWDTL